MVGSQEGVLHYENKIESQQLFEGIIRFKGINVNLFH